MTKRCLWVALAVAALGSCPAAAQTITGSARAVDGDSLSVSGISIRLFGVDAPEAKQTCSKDGAAWACGTEAQRTLQSLVDGSIVRCERRTIDIYGRSVSVCYAGGVDVGRAMVTGGWALAFTRYSNVYEGDEAQAKAAGLGIWSSEFELPQDYRARNRLAENGAADRPAEPRQSRQARVQPFSSTSGCVIKGNRNRRGQWIYHLPGMPYYDQTRAEEMFCTEAQAQAAGYRRAIVR